MARYYADERGIVVYELEPFEDDALVKTLFRKCWEATGQGFFFCGAHGGEPAGVMKTLFEYWNKLYALRYDGCLEFAMNSGLDEAFFDSLLLIWDAYDMNHIWFFTETPQALPTEMLHPETVKLPPHIKISRTGPGDMVIDSTGALKVQIELIIKSLGLEHRDTPV